MIPMKNWLNTIFILCCLVSLISCKKQNNSTNNHNTTGTNEGGNTTCTATKAAAENIQIFPADNAWNKDISSSPVDTYNTQIILAIASFSLKADFGSGLWNGAHIGIPYIVVCGNQPKTTIRFTDYGDESDPGPYPIPLTAPIEGNGAGDAHVIAVDIENKKIYELFDAHVNGNRLVGRLHRVRGLAHADRGGG